MAPVRCLLDRAHSVRLYLPTNLSSDALRKPLALNTVADFEAVQKVIALRVSGQWFRDWCTMGQWQNHGDFKIAWYWTIFMYLQILVCSCPYDVVVHNTMVLHQSSGQTWYYHVYYVLSRILRPGEYILRKGSLSMWLHAMLTTSSGCISIKLWPYWPTYSTCGLSLSDWITKLH